MTAKKFTEEELKNITEVRDENVQIITSLGEVELQVFLVTEELKKLEEMKSTLQIQFKNLQATETELVTTLNDKYGKGTVDINTGEFVAEN
jgi:predicted nuclease with TOPRIM domain